MPDQVDLGHAARLPPREAIRYFRAKGYRVSWDWWEVWQGAHARAFTVAKAMRLDVLESIRGAVGKALERGQTRREFAREIEPRLRALGWWGRQFVAGPEGVERVQLGSPWRLRTIFDTNMRATYGAAREQAQAATVDVRPYWMYSSRQDSRVRPAHAALDGAVFRADDPIWKTHYPPNGWNCRCRVRPLTERQVRARGVRVLDTRRGDGELREVLQEVGTNKRTGEVIERPGTAYDWTDPTGKRWSLLPDPGWSYNPGRGGQNRLTPPPEPGPLRRPPAGADARRGIAEAVAPIRRRQAEQARRLREIDAADPRDVPYGARGLVKQEIRATRVEARAVALRRIRRDRPAPWRAGETDWADEGLRQRWGGELEEWRRMVSPGLVGRLRAPRVVRQTPGEVSAAGYWDSRILMEPDAHGGTMIHEASHLLERDEGAFRAAVAFLGRRTRGDVIEVINARGDIGRRDRWVNPEGRPDFYPGRLYPSEMHPPGGGVHDARVEGAPGEPAIVPVREGHTGPVDVHATEVLSQGMEWLWQDPVGFMEHDPEYFDFNWDTVVGGD